MNTNGATGVVTLHQLRQAVGRTSATVDALRQEVGAVLDAILNGTEQTEGDGNA